MAPDASLTVAEFQQRFGPTLDLHWSGGRDGADHPLFPRSEPRRSSVGHLNFIHPHRIQVLGSTELEYLEGLGKNSYQDALRDLFGGESILVIVADGEEVPEALRREADATATPLLATGLDSPRLIQHIHYYLGHYRAETVTIHGVFMEVIGIGVLLTGEAGIGKSELALELITRRHRLVADDAPEFSRVTPDIIIGSCPELLLDFIEVRGLGILNVRAMFGDSAIRHRKKLDLIVNLLPQEQAERAWQNRLDGSRRIRTLFDLEIPEIDLPVAPGRNLSVLVEAAARNEVLRFSGYDASEDFERRQAQLMERGGS